MLFILAGNRWIVLAGVLLWAVGVSMGFPLGMSAAAESGPDPAARVSVVASIGYFANLAGPPAIGVLAQSAGLLNALWLIVALFLAAFAAAGSLRPRPAAPAGSERSGGPPYLQDPAVPAGALTAATTAAGSGPGAAAPGRGLRVSGRATTIISAEKANAMG